MSNKNIRFATININGILSNIPYVEHCLKSADVMVIQEHWLYPDSLNFLQTFHQDFTGWGRSSKDLNLDSTWRRGKGGVAILWRKVLDRNIERLFDIGNDRIMAIRIKTVTGCNLFIISVYLPSSNSSVNTYKMCLEELEDVINQLYNRGKIIVLGDLNCHIGMHGGSRSFSELNERGKLFVGLMQRFSFISLNSQQLCSGPLETFYSSNGHIKTTVDHILIKEDQAHLIKSCYVGDDNSSNLSFHRPIFCVFQADLKSTPTCLTSRINWRNIRIATVKEAYQHDVAVGLENDSECETSLTNLNAIEQSLAKITSIVKLSAERSIPKTKLKKNLKPFWKEGLKPLHESCRRYRRLWIMQGRPRGSENCFFSDYKRAKRNFRRELRRKAFEYESREYERLGKTFEVDNSSFQRIMSKRRKQRGMQTKSLKIDGKLIDEPDDLRNVWKEHYSQLYTPKLNPEYDESFLNYVTSCVKRYENESYFTDYDALDDIFTVEEVNNTIVQLPNGKSSGPDGLTYEHIKYGGIALITLLTTILNAITSLETVPKDFTMGNIISLYKTNKKNRYNKDNYRGITLTNILSKNFERLILNRWMPYFEEKGFPNNLQFAYQKEKSCIDASMSLQESILHNIEHGSKVYCCFLDSTKAFDTVWIDGLFFKMYNLGIQGKTWRLLRNWYSALTSRVLFDGVVSDDFSILQGVRQGSVLSPWLFMIFNDDLPEMVNKCNQGLMLDSLSCNPIMVADDVTLTSTRVKGLQKMLNTLESYSRKWRFDFSPTKTVVITFGESTQMFNKLKRYRKWTLYDRPIEQKRAWPHVGIELSGNFSSAKRTEQVCIKAKFQMSSLMSIGACPSALNPICACSLWRTVGIPTSLYGCELWNNLTTSEIESLERTQRFNAKRIQGLDPMTRSEATTGSIGLWSMEGTIDKAKLIYFGRLCRSKEILFSKRIFTARLTSHMLHPARQKLGFIPDIIRTLNKYNLANYLTTYLDEQSFPSKLPWKNIVYDAIENIEIEKWKNGMSDKDELTFYRRTHATLKPLYLWEVAKRNPCHKASIALLVNILCGNTPQTFNSWISCEDSVDNCNFCGEQSSNIPFHFVMLCPNFNSWRNKLWDKITETFPLQIVAELFSLDNTELYESIISGNMPSRNEEPDVRDRFAILVARHIRALTKNI